MVKEWGLQVRWLGKGWCSKLRNCELIVNSGFYGKKFSAAKFFYCLALIRALMSLNLIIFSSSDPIMS